MGGNFVLDAWALLAWLQGEEPAAGRVRQLFQAAERQQVRLFVSILNLGEVYYRVGRLRGRVEAGETLDQIRRLPIAIQTAGDDLVMAAAGLKIDYAISYADAFAAASAEALDATLATGDPELVRLQGRFAIEKLERTPRPPR